MGTFLDAITILAITAWLIRLGLSGAISVETVAIAMIGLVALVAVARAIGSGLIRLAFRIGLPVAAIAVLVVWESGGDARAIKEIATGLAALFIALLGFYIMSRGAFRRK